jgi:membrane protein required for colicin V production
VTWLDYAVIGVFAVSMALGAWRGLVREVVSLLGWVVAFLAANLLAGPLGPSMPDVIPTPELKVAAAYAAVFLGALVVTSLAGLLLSKIVSAVGLGGIDRTLGAVFGTARAALVVVAATLLAGLTSAPREPWWRDSACGKTLVQIALALKPLLPPAFTERLRYE